MAASKSGKRQKRGRRSPEPSEDPPSERAPRRARNKSFAPRARTAPPKAGFFGLPIHASPTQIPDVDVLLGGLPFESGIASRFGAQYGPQSVRSASAELGLYSEALGIDIVSELEMADGGDLAIPTHDPKLSLAAISSRAESVARSGCIGGDVGGDQCVTLGVLRGIRAAKLKSVGFIHIDARPDTAGALSGRHVHAHSAVRLAAEEGLINPEATIHVGLRGPSEGPAEYQCAVGLGFEIAKTDDVRWDLYSVVRQLRGIVRKGSVYISVDVSVLDPSVAPGTSSPRPGGMSAWELQQLLRAVVGAEIVGFDVVEVNPRYDVGELSALAAAAAVHEILAAIADTRRSARPAPSSAPRRGRRVSA